MGGGFCSGRKSEWMDDRGALGEDELGWEVSSDLLIQDFLTVSNQPGKLYSYLLIYVSSKLIISF